MLSYVFLCMIWVCEGKKGDSYEGKRGNLKLFLAAVDRLVADWFALAD